LTAIDPKGESPPVSASFTSGEEVLKWVAVSASCGKNIYFGVNPTLRQMFKKASREDISELTWLHVDVDPDKKCDFQEERVRISELVLSPQKGTPMPNLVIDSGGGYQCFWRLTDPMPIRGNQTAYETAASYNRSLERKYNADHCHNVDRIMRLPYTTNFPNAKKIIRGQKESLATVVYYDQESHSLSEFNSMPLTQDSGLLLDYDPSCEVDVDPMEPASYVDLDNLPTSVKDSVKAVIISGEDPVQEGRWEGDRSAALLWVCCRLHEADVADALIFSILLDPDYRISASVLDKGSASACRRYAMRQISRAKQFVADPELMQLNEKYACIQNMGGKFRITTEVIVPGAKSDRTALTYMAPTDFKAAYANRFKETTSKNGETKLTPLAEWWLRHPKRRQYETLVFAPEREIPNAFNLWRGFSFPPIKGCCDLYLSHLRDVVCNGNDVYYDYLTKWMASCVQHPNQPGQVAVVLRGKKGVGKGQAVDHFGKLFGRHFMQVTNSRHITGQFNAHLQDCIVLFGDEAFYAGDKAHESVLKGLVTEDLLNVEKKGIDIAAQQSCLHIIMSSNDKWVVPSSGDERRFFVLDVGESHRQDIPYFLDMQAQLSSGGYEALLYHLMHLDLTGFQVRLAPRTEALQEQQLLSMPYHMEWFYNKLERGYWLDDHETWKTQVAVEMLVEDYKRSCPTGRKSSTRIAKEIEELMRCCSSSLGKKRSRNPIILASGNTMSRPVYFTNLYDLEDSRRAWCEHTGLSVEWPDPIALMDDEVLG